jgi:hypothetical protein
MNFIERWIRHRFKAIGLCLFSPTEAFWGEVYYWKNFMKSIPFRIKCRRISIWDLYH